MIADGSGKLALGKLRLQKLEFDIVHRPATVYQAEEALPLLETEAAYTSELEEYIPFMLLR